MFHFKNVSKDTTTMKSQIDIKLATFEDIKTLSSKANAENVSVKSDAKTKYIAGYINGGLVGFVGYMEMKNTIRYKSDYVIPICRGKGVYKTLWKERDKVVEKEYGLIEKTAFCTPKSINTYLKNGFQKIKINNNGYWYVKKEVL